MEDWEVSGYEDHSISGQLSATLHDHVVTSQELSKLSAVLSSALPGGDTTASGLGISILRLDNRQLLKPPALGQDWALGSTIPRYRCLPTENYAIAMDYGLFDKKLPVTIAMSGVGGDITGNLEDDLPLPVRTVPPRGQPSFRSGPRLLHTGPSRHYRHGSGDGN